MLASHYAPRAHVVLVEDEAALDEELARHPGAAVLGRGVGPVDYARGLYDALRAADAADAEVVVALLPPAAGLGHAIRDRLVKAAADRAG
jgi:L-threonylcarbamoyladenylate synthase